jgi:hypothetical protein
MNNRPDERRLSHYELARLMESVGFEVLADPDDNLLSHVATSAGDAPGVDFKKRIFAEIRGDSEAVMIYKWRDQQ